VTGGTRLRRALGLFETAGVSVAMMAPTAAMALNGALAASYAHATVPFAFVLAFAMIGCIAFAFVTFARVYASPASVGEFNARGLGPFAGRLSGWALLLVYVLFTAGSAAEFGAFAAAAFAHGRIAIWWVPLALGCLTVTAYVGTRPARTSSRAMLVVEGVSVAAVVAKPKAPHGRCRLQVVIHEVAAPHLARLGVAGQAIDETAELVVEQLLRNSEAIIERC
jgi:amino acid transporter